MMAYLPWGRWANLNRKEHSIGPQKGISRQEKHQGQEPKVGNDSANRQPISQCSRAEGVAGTRTQGKLVLERDTQVTRT